MQEAAEARALIGTMVHGTMADKLAANRLVAEQFIGREKRLAACCRDDLGAQRLSRDVRNMETAAFAVAVHRRENDMLLRLFLGEGAVPLLAAEIAFIDLNNLVLAADG